MKFSKNKLQKIIDEEVRAILFERDGLADIGFDAGQETIKQVVRQGLRNRMGTFLSSAVGAAAGGAAGILFPDDLGDGTPDAGNKLHYGAEAIYGYIVKHHPEIEDAESLMYRILAYQDVQGVSQFHFMRDQSRGEKSATISKVKNTESLENDFKIINKLMKDFVSKMAELRQDISNDNVKESFSDYYQEVKSALEKDWAQVQLNLNKEREEKEAAIPQLSTPKRSFRKAPYQPDPLYEYIQTERGKIL